LKLGVPKEVARGAGDIVLAAPLNEILRCRVAAAIMDEQ
jgi:hypothetical protein